ncbi:DsbA family protein [Nitrosopumilus sp.]|uniref:DsbA family protein n=1 Tax=Nitrosopumilus sp. TaxID=2024843 RepID=UPI00292E1B8D|nr:thioredoxin domain-containing protein [Nitrosopumilus sp.]
MAKLFLLAIPVVIGVITGTFLADFPAETEARTLTSTKLIDNGSPILGSSDAPITILEWGDYQCTFCYRFHQDTLDKIDEDFIKTGKVKLVFKDFPLNGPDSVMAAEASYCANDQKKYWQYHDELYKNWGGEKTGWITRDSLERFAISVELDLEKFNACLDSGKYQNHVLSSYKFGQEIGIDATPSFLIFNDEKVMKIRGNQPLEIFLKSFEEL